MEVRSSLNPQYPNALKNSFAKQMDFWDSFKPIYYFSRAFGLMPFSIRRDAHGKVQEPKVNGIDGFWFLFTILIVFLSGAYISHQHTSAFNSNTRSLLQVLGAYYSFMNLIFGALLIVMDMINRFKLVELWKNFIIFDEEVTILNSIPKAISRLMYLSLMKS